MVCYCPEFNVCLYFDVFGTDPSTALQPPIYAVTLKQFRAVI